MTFNFSRIQEDLGKFSVSVLPDFFADRILYVPSIKKLLRAIEQKAGSGGGSLRGYQQREIKGGNAANLAFALARLGLATNLFIIGDKIATGLMADHPRNCNVRVIEGKPGYTLAVEFPYRGKRVNVMVSDVGDLADFSGDSLSKADLKAIADSDCIALVNWSSNSKGNDLAQMAFSLHKRHDRLNFLDPADLSDTETRIRGLIERVAGRGLLDVLSINENESRILSSSLSTSRLPRDYNAEAVRRIAKSLNDIIGVNIDIHTPIGSASAINGETFWSDVVGKVDGIVTGAGDVWDAGDIAGYLVGIEPEGRLNLANSCAYLYLASKDARPPTLREVFEFARQKGITF